MSIKRHWAYVGLTAVTAATLVTAPIRSAIAEPVFPLVVPLGDIPTAQITVLGQGPITTPGIEDATLSLDAGGGANLPQFVLEEGNAVRDCSPGYAGVIALTATGTTVGGSLYATASLSGTRTDEGHAGEAFEIGAAGEWAVPATEVLPSTQILAVCVALEPYVGSQPSPSPTPTPETTPTPAPTPEPTPTASPSPALPTGRSVSAAADHHEVDYGDRVVFTGRIEATEACRGGQAISLRASQSTQSSYHVLRSETTDGQGYFSFETVVGDARRFLVAAPASADCPYAESAPIVLSAAR